jgi:GABA permease
MCFLLSDAPDVHTSSKQDDAPCLGWTLTSPLSADRRSETVKIFKQRQFMAIPLVLVILGVLFILFAAASVGLWAWLLVGAVGLIVCALLVQRVARSHRHPVDRDAPPALGPPDAGSVHRVLVIADGACTAEALHGAIDDHAAGNAVEAFVVAPALGSRLDRWTGDQQGYDTAADHLDGTLRALEEIGAQAHGRIGSKDPVQAADDGLREFPAHQLVMAVHPTDGQKWLEQDSVDAARERYDIPVTVIVVDAS